MFKIKKIRKSLNSLRNSPFLHSPVKRFSLSKFDAEASVREKRVFFLSLSSLSVRLLTSDIYSAINRRINATPRSPRLSSVCKHYSADAESYDAKSYSGPRGYSQHIHPARLITIKYDCMLAIKRDSLFVYEKDEHARCSHSRRFVKSR